MAERESGTYHEGDLVRVTNKDTGEGFQTRVRAHVYANGRKALFLSKDWSADWEKWTFLDWWISMGTDTHTLELIERAPDPLPTEPGLYRVIFDNDERYWEHANGDWFEVNTNPNVYTKPDGFVSMERMYTKEEVIPVVREWAYNIDSDYEYGGFLNALVKKLEATL